MISLGAKIVRQCSTEAKYSKINGTKNWSKSNSRAAIGVFEDLGSF
jgi:hypothetical protein